MSQAQKEFLEKLVGSRFVSSSSGDWGAGAPFFLFRQLLPGFLSGGHPVESRFEPVPPLEVAGRAGQRPFPGRFLEAAQHKPAKARRAFDDPANRFHGLPAQFIFFFSGRAGQPPFQDFTRTGSRSGGHRFCFALQVSHGAVTAFAFQGGRGGGADATGARNLFRFIVVYGLTFDVCERSKFLHECGSGKHSAETEYIFPSWRRAWQ